jgi:PRTRC genetic system ThiF family protein
MQTLSIEPTIPYIFSQATALRIALVGCGGTGSHIAQSLARIVAHVGERNLQLIFIDGDTVEAKNVGRQLFSPAEVGRSKAKSLAARFNAALGQRITAIGEMATVETLCEFRSDVGANILVGAVDSATGRQAMHDALRNKYWHLWLDVGNHEQSGQVVCGTTTERDDIQRALTIPSICRALPAPSLVYPELLKEQPTRQRMDCAAAQEDNAQSLMVNQMMAAIAGEYLYNLIVRRQLATFITEIDLHTLSMRSTPITRRTLAPYC